ncbi:MAG: MBL fold metallo-hydrolase [Candidatus Promineifilaceae bacterium]|nr:MBL fold metallo-hydrolase [Candidatus Promineifilaceae bacterium]
MLDVRQHGPVTEVRLTSTILGRPLYSVAAFYFDGVLFDTGPPRTGRELAAWARGVEIERIVNTHQHEDHVGGNAFLPSVPALAPAGALPTIRQAPPLPLYRRVPFGQPRPAHADPLGDTVSTRSHTLQVIPTPGHAPDHVVLLLPQKGWLIGGDLFLMERAKYVRQIDDVAQWMDSLRAILAYDFDVLFCGHAGRVPDAKAAIRRKIAYWEELGEKAREMADQGHRAEEIRDSLLGNEGLLTYWSRGRFAKLNLIEQLLAMEISA